MAAIVHNSGVNYTLYYNILNYFKTIMNNHPSIQVVTQGLIQDFDTREFPQYPVGNISILSSNFIGTTTEWEIQLVVADKIKNKNNESDGAFNTQTIPFYGVDDTVDIHANTLAIINDLTSYTARSVDGFEILDNVLCEPFEDRFNNGLAGWVCTFTLTVHNDRNRCIFFLISPDGNGYKIQDCLTSEYKYAVISGSVNVGDYFSSQIGTTTNCFYVDSEVTNFNSWDYVNLKPITNYISCIECQTGILPTTSTTTISPTTSTTTIEPTTSTTTAVPTTSTTTLVPTTSTTTLVPTTTLAPTTSTTTVEPTTSTTTLVPTTSTTTLVPTTSTTTLVPTTTTEAPTTSTTTIGDCGGGTLEMAYSVECERVIVTVVAGGTSPYTYQWYYSETGDAGSYILISNTGRILSNPTTGYYIVNAQDSTAAPNAWCGTTGVIIVTNEGCPTTTTTIP